MALTKDNLIQLIAIQEQDAALDKLKADIDKIPVFIANLRSAIDAEKNKASDLKNRLLTLEKKKKEKELELAQKEEAAKKHGAELNSVKTNEAFKALQVEIERAKAQGSDIETQILEIMEDLDKTRKLEKAAANEAAVEVKKLEAEIGVHEARVKELQAQFDAAKAKRDEAATPISADAMRVYNHVRSRGKLNAVVAIDGTNCSACRISLAPQVIVEATKAKALVTCESCQRIIYRPETLAAKAA
jgi:predicted  nucleic acid-binding Zn-ribbon protein